MRAGPMPVAPICAGRRQFGLQVARGALVVEPQADSPAAKPDRTRRQY